MNGGKFVVRVYGESCNYWVGRGGSGVPSRADAVRFSTEWEARAAMTHLRDSGRITSRWEIQRAATAGNVA